MKRGRIYAPDAKESEALASALPAAKRQKTAHELDGKLAQTFYSYSRGGLDYASPLKDWKQAISVHGTGLSSYWRLFYSDTPATPLMFAATYDALDAVKLLVEEYKVALDTQNSAGQSALQLAFDMRCTVRIIPYLVSKGADYSKPLSLMPLEMATFTAADTGEEFKEPWGWEHLEAIHRGLVIKASEQRFAFLCGTHPRLGESSSIRNHLMKHRLFDRHSFGMILDFLGVEQIQVPKHLWDAGLHWPNRKHTPAPERW